MTPNSNFKELLSRFNENGVRYMVTGGYAVMLYAEPRYTKDLDIWVEPSPTNAEKVHLALAQFGAPMAGVTPQTSPLKVCSIKWGVRRFVLIS